MYRLFLLSAALLISCSLPAQHDFQVRPPAGSPVPLDLNSLKFQRPQAPAIAPSTVLSHLRPRLNPANFRQIQRPLTAGITIRKDADNGQVYLLRGRPEILGSSRPDKADAYAYLAAVAPDLRLEDVEAEVRITEEITDGQGRKHVRLAQYFQGIPVFPADARLHGGADGFDLYTGRLQPTPSTLTTVLPTLSEARARTQVRTMFAQQWNTLNAQQLAWISGPQLETELTIFSPTGKEPRLAWHVNVRPNLLEHTSLMLDAHTGSTLATYTHTCGFGEGHEHLSEGNHNSPGRPDREDSSGEAAEPASVADGPATARVQNLYDQFVTINTYEQADTFYLVDGAQPMARVINNQLVGLLQTYDGRGNSPLREDFNPGLRISLNNLDWTKTEASVHSNATTAYQYFLTRHQRNSINGNGGNIYSFLNINETDGTEMDNAFWNGQALFYGNGADAFQRLPRGLDVAGHEMAHGVIQNTAGLIYQEQSGAMNESFADIFGYLIEGETGDYRIGEDVVTSFFPSGTMRDLRNPNNGATRFGQRGWQPAHMDEYVTLPNNEEGDNGGVHINSGITNRAFYLFSSDPAVGDATAEKVYYNALNLYLTRSARFADLRIAVVEASQPFGAAVVAAAENAFAAVGIGGEAGDYTVDLEANEGDRFLLLANTGQNALFLADEEGALLENPLQQVGLSSRPSVTDDGQFAVFVDDAGEIRILNLNTNQLSYLEATPRSGNWRNIAISKDGTRIAMTTQNNDNIILVFDFLSEQARLFSLYNPTTASGQTTGDVRYADALEWEPGGEFLMYDALSRLDDGLEFWDIGFLRVWDNRDNGFSDGQVIKLPVNVAAGISIGNPTFSKNSPYIIAYEEVDFAAGTFRIIGANIETGTSAGIINNTTVNYPNYGLQDDRIVFDAKNQEGENVLGVVPLGSDKISASGQPFVLIEGGHWGYYFANGSRDLNTGGLQSPVVEDEQVVVYPTLTTGSVTVETGVLRLTGPLRVLDMAGRMLKQTTTTAGATTLDLSQLSRGSYFIAVPTEKGTIIRRVIRQ